MIGKLFVVISYIFSILEQTVLVINTGGLYLKTASISEAFYDALQVSIITLPYDIILMT